MRGGGHQNGLKNCTMLYSFSIIKTFHRHFTNFNVYFFFSTPPNAVFKQTNSKISTPSLQNINSANFSQNCNHLLSGFHRLKSKHFSVRGLGSFPCHIRMGVNTQCLSFVGTRTRHQINHQAGTFPDYTRQPRWHTGLVLKRPRLLDTAQNHCPNPGFLSL